MHDSTTAQSQIPDDWLDRLKANDEKLLQALYTANYARVEKYILDNSGEVADAGDIYQEAFIAVWRNVQLGRVTFPSLDKLQGYLFRVAQFKWLDQLRMKKRQKINASDLLPTEEEILPMEKEDEQYLEKVRSGYQALGEPCKELLYRFYFSKQSMSEIAAVFSWTEATAKNNKYRCLQRLRNKILPEKTEP